MPTRRPSKIELFKDKEGKWRWRRKAPNGHVVSGPQQGYSSKGHMYANMLKMNADSDKLRIVDLWATGYAHHHQYSRDPLS